MAEQDARKKNFQIYGHSEVTLNEIYEFVPDFIGEKTELTALEVMTECDYCYINPELLKLIEIANRLSLLVVLASDMYLNKSQLKQILRSNSVDLNLIKEIYVSSEQSGDKSSGALFRKLQFDFPQTPPDKILHIGDKFEADYNSPRSLGFQAYHYSTVPESLQKIFEHKKMDLTSPSILSSLRGLGIRLTGEPDSFERQVGAGILGPVLTEFAEWVLDICEQENINQVFPFRRETELFLSILENAAKKRSLEIKIESLYVSRESTWLASLKEWGEEELDNLLEKHNISVCEIFRMLGIPLPKSFDLEYLDRKAIDLNPQQLERLKHCLLSEFVVGSINQNISLRCQSLSEYIDQTIDLSKKSIMLDLGFRGTINLNIEKAMANEQVDLKLTHLLVFGSDSVIELKKGGINIRSFLASASINQDNLKIIQQTCFLLESLIFGRTKEVSGYKKIDGKQSPVLNNQFLEKNEIESKAKIFDAIMVYQNLWQKVASAKPNILKKAYINTNFKKELSSLIYGIIDVPRSKFL